MYIVLSSPKVKHVHVLPKYDEPIARSPTSTCQRQVSGKNRTTILRISAKRCLKCLDPREMVECGLQLSPSRMQAEKMSIVRAMREGQRSRTGGLRGGRGPTVVRRTEEAIGIGVHLVQGRVYLRLGRNQCGRRKGSTAAHTCCQGWTRAAATDGIDGKGSKRMAAAARIKRQRSPQRKRGVFANKKGQSE